ncbi:MAG TPA: LysR family transcriptional regulator [Aliidongia sp.]|nr:LysR family transcriptional regulator [Aliidongia sp.]
MSDRFEVMQAFIAVCDAQGFSAGARKVGLSPSVVTRMVAGLETRLDVRLLHRTTRSVRLTDAGARYLERARRIVAEVEEAELSAQEERGEPTGRLVVAAPVVFGRLHATPLLTRYLELYPKVSVELQLANHFVNLVEEGVDVAIRVGELVDSGLIARNVGQTRRTLVASPAYLAKCGVPQAPSELAGHRLIAFSGAASRREWPFWSEGTVSPMPVSPQFFSNSGDAAIDHAIAGGGIVSALSYQVVAACRAGRLVEVLQAFAPPPLPIQAVFPTSRLLSRKVRAFIDLVELSASAWQLDDQPPSPGT